MTMLNIPAPFLEVSSVPCSSRPQPGYLSRPSLLSSRRHTVPSYLNRSSVSHSCFDLVQYEILTHTAVRLTLATINVLSLWKMDASALLLTTMQFHIPFYAGRTLPNMLAFPLGESDFMATLHNLTVVLQFSSMVYAPVSCQASGGPENPVSRSPRHSSLRTAR